MPPECARLSQYSISIADDTRYLKQGPHLLNKRRRHLILALELSRKGVKRKPGILLCCQEGKGFRHEACCFTHQCRVPLAADDGVTVAVKLPWCVEYPRYVRRRLSW